MAALHVYVSPPPDPNIRDDELVELADEERHRLEVALRSRVSEHLGPEFDAEISDVRPGSVEIVALILLVGSLVGSYNTVREGLRNLREDWRTLGGSSKSARSLVAQGRGVLSAWARHGNSPDWAGSCDGTESDEPGDDASTC